MPFVYQKDLWVPFLCIWYPFTSYKLGPFDFQDAVSSYEQVAKLLEIPENRGKATPQMWNNMGTIFSTFGTSCCIISVVYCVLEVVLSAVNHELARILGKPSCKNSVEDVGIWQPMRWPCNGSTFLWTGPWACWGADHPLLWPSEKGRKGQTIWSCCQFLVHSHRDWWDRWESPRFRISSTVGCTMTMTLTVKIFTVVDFVAQKKPKKTSDPFTVKICRSWRSPGSAWSSTGPGWLKVIPRDPRLLRQCLSTSQCRRSAVIPNLGLKAVVNIPEN